MELVDETTILNADEMDNDPRYKNLNQEDVFALFKGTNQAQMRKIVKEGFDLTLRHKSGPLFVHRLANDGYLNMLVWLVDEGFVTTREDDKSKPYLHDMGIMGHPPIYYATIKGHFKVVKWLAENGGNINILDRISNTLLHAASEQPNLELVMWMVKICKLDPSAKNEWGTTPLTIAVDHGVLGVVLFFVYCCNIPIDATHLRVAVANDHKMMVAWMVEDVKMDVNFKNKENTNAADLAACKRHFELMKWLVEEGKAECKNKNTRTGWTLLHQAAYYGHFESVKWLVLEKGLDVNEKDNENRTPLHMAVSNTHIEIGRWLVTIAGADPDVKDIQGRTPLDYTLQYGYKGGSEWLIKSSK